VSIDLSFCRCACCSALHIAYIDTSGSPYCDRCEVAYLEFKLGLLLAATGATRKIDEV